MKEIYSRAISRVKQLLQQIRIVDTRNSEQVANQAVVEVRKQDIPESKEIEDCLTRVRQLVIKLREGQLPELNERELLKNTREISLLVVSKNYEEAGVLIKISLKFCHNIPNKGKYLKEEYKLFKALAKIYVNKGGLRDYPKAAGIYEYLKVLVTKLDPAEQVAFNQEVQECIEQLEEKFVRLYISVIAKNFNTKVSLLKINEHKEKLDIFRKKVKEDLDNLENSKETSYNEDEKLDEKKLLTRAEKVEEIYRKIQAYFIGENGLFKQLIEGSISELGGIPEVTKRDGTRDKLKYAFFAMGSLALCTMTPWSDFEGGIFIEDKLLPEDEQRAKEFLRRVTVLFQMKLIAFGESPLRMLGIEALNDFKGSLEQAGEDWFFDNLINSGISFDGLHYHACKTPLGREKGYHALVEGQMIQCRQYELIGTVEEFMQFQSDESWYKQDSFLVKALCNIIYVSGNQQLTIDYKNRLSKQYEEIVRSRAFKALKDEAKDFDPARQIWGENQDGQILNVKKEIYRVPDRIVTALSNCLGIIGSDSWTIRGLSISQNLYVALAIGAELRLRAYSYNNSQIEYMRVFIYEKKVKEGSTAKLDEVFYLRNTELLVKYYCIVLMLAKIVRNESYEQLRWALNSEIIEETPNIVGYVYRRLMQYKLAITEFEKIVDKSIGIKNDLACLYTIVGQPQKGRSMLQENLKALQVKYFNQDHPDIATTYNTLGDTYQLEDNHVALENFRNGLEMRQRLLNSGQTYPQIEIDFASSLCNVASILQQLGCLEESLSKHRESLRMRIMIHKEKNHLDIVKSYNNLGNVLESFRQLAVLHGKQTEAIEYQKEALDSFKKSVAMIKRIFKGVHPLMAAPLMSVGCLLEEAPIKDYKKALDKKEETLDILREFYGKEHQYIAGCLNNIGTTLLRLRKYEEALAKYEGSLKIAEKTYKQTHPHVHYFKKNTIECILLIIRDYYTKALQEKSNSNKVGFEEYLSKAKIMFEKAINLNISISSLYTEYAMFLIINESDKYEQIVLILNKSITIEDDKPGLMYNRHNKVITVKAIEELLEMEKTVEIKPYILAHYLLISIHNLHGHKQLALEALDNLRKVTDKLTDGQEKKIAQYFLDYAHKELFISEVVVGKESWVVQVKATTQPSVPQSRL